MIPGMNPKQMQKMMKQMGIKQEDLDAQRVEVFFSDKKLVFDNPELSKVNMMGQDTYQLLGDAREESLDATPDISAEDVQTVVDQTGVGEEKAREAIDACGGDLAEAILKLSE